MRHFKKGLLALATTAALMPAGVAAADGALLEICEGPNACRDATVVEVVACGVSVVEVNAILAGTLTEANCSNGNKVHKK
jgi:Ser/Thr protein kinase RdoA (MazF antagonist)